MTANFPSSKDFSKIFQNEVAAEGFEPTTHFMLYSAALNSG